MQNFIGFSNLRKKFSENGSVIENHLLSGGFLHILSFGIIRGKGRTDKFLNGIGGTYEAAIYEAKGI